MKKLLTSLFIVLGFSVLAQSPSTPVYNLKFIGPVGGTNVVGGMTQNPAVWTNSLGGSLFTGLVTTNISLVANTNLVPYGPNDGFISNSIPLGAGNFGAHAGETSMQWLQDGQMTRLRTGGGNTIKAVMLDVPSLAGLTGLYLEIWRTNTLSNFRYVGTSENLIGEISAGSNFVTLASPITGVQEGDWTGAYVTYSSAIAQNFFITNGATFAYQATNSTDNCTNYSIINKARSGNGYNWYSGSTIKTQMVCFEVFCQAPVFVAYGDSLTAGHPLNVGFNASFPFGYSSYLGSIVNGSYWQGSTSYQLSTKLGGVTYQNNGVGGYTTYQMATNFLRDVVNMKPKSVILEGGFNDPGNSISTATTQSNLWWMASTAISNGIQVIWHYLYPSGAAPSGPGTTQSILNPWIEAMGASNNIVVVNSNPYTGTNSYTSGGPNVWYMQGPLIGDPGVNIHWSPTGYAQISEATFDALQASSPVKATTMVPTKSFRSAAERAYATGTNGIFTGFDTNTMSGVVQANTEGQGPSQLDLNRDGGNVGIAMRGAPAPYPLSIGDNTSIFGSLYAFNGGVWASGFESPNPPAGIPGVDIQQSGGVGYFDSILSFGSTFNPWFGRGSTFQLGINGGSQGGFWDGSGNYVQSQRMSVMSPAVDDSQIRSNYRDDTGLLANANKPSWTLGLGRQSDSTELLRAPTNGTGTASYSVMDHTDSSGTRTQIGALWATGDSLPNGLPNAIGMELNSGIGYITAPNAGNSAFLQVIYRTLWNQFYGGGFFQGDNIPSNGLAGIVIHYQSGIGYFDSVLSYGANTYSPLVIRGSRIDLAPNGGSSFTIGTTGVTNAYPTILNNTINWGNNAGAGNGIGLTNIPPGAISGGTLFTQFADAANSGTAVTVLYTNQFTAGQLSANGQSIKVFYSGVLTNNAGGLVSVDLKVAFGESSPSTVYDSGADVVGTSGVGAFKIELEIMRVSSSSVIITATDTTTGTLINANTQITTLTGLTLSGNENISLIGTASGAQAATAAVVAKMARANFYPAN